VLPAPFAQVPPTFQPDTLWNYELGEKSTLLDDRATLNFDIYDIEWSHMQATDNVGGINQLVNAGDSRVKGAELAFDFRVRDDLTIGGSAAYTDANLTTPASVLGVQSPGAQLPLSPKFNFALQGTYMFALGGDFSGAVNVSDVYVGSRDAGYDVPLGAGNPLYKLASYNTVNFNLAFFMPHNTELDFYVKNVFDEVGEVSANTVSDQYLNPAFGQPYAPVPVWLSQPRTVGMVLKVALDK
jgi:outer membrane receptor protein involved in Fe transport